MSGGQDGFSNKSYREQINQHLDAIEALRVRERMLAATLAYERREVDSRWIEPPPWSA